MSTGGSEQAALSPCTPLSKSEHAETEGGDRPETDSINKVSATSNRTDSQNGVGDSQLRGITQSCMVLFKKGNDCTFSDLEAVHSIQCWIFLLSYK